MTIGIRGPQYADKQTTDGAHTNERKRTPVSAETMKERSTILRDGTLVRIHLHGALISCIVSADSHVPLHGECEHHELDLGDCRGVGSSRRTG